MASELSSKLVGIFFGVVPDPFVPRLERSSLLSSLWTSSVCSAPVNPLNTPLSFLNPACLGLGKFLNPRSLLDPKRSEVL